MRASRIVLVATLIGSLLAPAASWAASAPDKGVAWEPRPLSRALYGTKAPDEDPDTQRHYVEGHDGVDLYVETWLPAPKAGKTPPKKVPTILIMTPYVSQGVEEYPAGSLPSFIEYFNSLGYAVAQHHVRGTGESGGCLEQTASNQWDDGARVVEYLGKEAPWSNGRVGMYGISYDAETQISTAAYGDPKRTKYLKAIVPAASVGSQYDWNYMDGVAWAGQPLIGNSSYLAGVSMVPGQEPAPQRYPEKFTCQAEVMTESANQSGDFTKYWQDREYRPGAPKVRAATLMVHGLRDFNVQDITLAGFFDRLPKSTPHKGLFGVWNHAFPGAHSAVEPGWNRADWYTMVTAWFDRYLKGKDTGVEKWPDVQVQSSEGQWWGVDEFPSTGGPLGQLGLGPGGELGAARPEGETVFIEQTQVGLALPGQEAIFETKPVTAPLHLTGQPMLDLWLTSSQPDAHIGASLQIYGKDGLPLRHEGGSSEYQATYGARSLQHIEPMRRGWFEQEAGKPLPTNTPVRVTIRLLPTDLVVPKGATLRLTISGSVSYSKGDSLPSGAASTITLLHDCKHSSTLRFRMPAKSAKLLNIRETDEVDQVLTSRRARMGVQDGGGIAKKSVCASRPKQLPFL
jgi:predicted acyl esterase